MKIQFRSTRMDGSQGTWHDVLTPDGYGRRWLAPNQGWSGIEFREAPEQPESVSFAQLADIRDRHPACTCDGGNSFHGSDCPT